MCFFLLLFFFWVGCHYPAVIRTQNSMCKCTHTQWAQRKCAAHGWENSTDRKGCVCEKECPGKRVCMCSCSSVNENIIISISRRRINTLISYKQASSCIRIEVYHIIRQPRIPTIMENIDESPLSLSLSYNNTGHAHSITNGDGALAAAQEHPRAVKMPRR